MKSADQQGRVDIAKAINVVFLAFFYRLVNPSAALATQE